MIPKLRPVVSSSNPCLVSTREMSYVDRSPQVAIVVDCSRLEAVTAASLPGKLADMAFNPNHGWRSIAWIIIPIIQDAVLHSFSDVDSRPGSDPFTLEIVVNQNRTEEAKALIVDFLNSRGINCISCS